MLFSQLLLYFLLITSEFQYCWSYFSNSFFTKKEAEQIFTRADRGRMRESGFKLKEERFLIRCKEVILYCVGGEALEQAAQRSCGCPIHGSVRDQVR